MLDERNEPGLGRGRSLHILAILTAVAAFPLIWMGGLVTSHQAGLAVPDWPNSYGYNMFLFPVNEWIGGIFYEHTHRLLGTLVGFLAVLLTLNAWGPGQQPRVSRWLMRLGVASLMIAAVLGGMTLGIAGGEQLTRSEAASKLSHIAVQLAGLGLVLVAAGYARHREKQTWLRWACVIILAAIIVQGVLGGLRVVMVRLGLAVVHGVFAQVVFAGLVAIAALTRPRRPARPAPSIAASLGPWAIAASLAVFIQLVLGALMRHFGAGLAIPDLPLAFGHILPPTSSAGLAALETTYTLGQVWLHFSHRIGAVIVTILLITLIVKVIRRAPNPSAVFAAMVLAGLLGLQITLGVLTVLLKKPAELATAHVATGALLLAACVVVWIESIGLARPGAIRQSKPSFNKMEPLAT